MKSTLLPLVLGTAIFASAGAEGALLVGFEAFSANSADESETTSIASGFTGDLEKNTHSVATGGSLDGTYGASGFAAATGNGAVRVVDAGQTFFTFTNGTGDNYVLDSLVFDATRSAATTKILVSYSIDGGGFGAASAYEPNVLSNTSSGAAQDFDDHTFNLLGIALNAGSYITFLFDLDSPSGSGARLDNIALTGELSAIPEPGSLLALGCLVGFGGMIRTRRRGPRGC